MILRAKINCSNKSTPFHKMVECLRIVLSMSVVAFALCAPIHAQKPTTIVIIDHIGTDHATTRETRITRLQESQSGMVHYSVERSVRHGATVRYSKEGPAYLPPIILGKFAIYPEMYCRREGDDTAMGKEIQRLMFDETVQVVLEGETLDRLINKSVSVKKELVLMERTRTHAYCGFSAAKLGELSVPNGAVVRNTFPKLIKELGTGESGFVGDVVDEIVPGGPADLVGLHPGDLVVQMKSMPTGTERASEITCDYARPGTPISIIVARRSTNGEIEVQKMALVPSRSR